MYIPNQLPSEASKPMLRVTLIVVLSVMMLRFVTLLSMTCMLERTQYATH
jgi:hypothetical protein